MDLTPGMQKAIFLGLLVLVILLSTALVYLIFRLIKSEKKKMLVLAQYQDIEHKITSLQLETLESKLNPHLFKNVLNSIQSHAYQTYIALDKLANVLDYILYESRRKLVTVREETEFAMNLIEINKIKLSPLFELKVKSEINKNEPLYNQELLAPLISVDLIENAFKHADLQSPDAFIAITIGFKNNDFFLFVSNKISKKPVIEKPNSGIGSEALMQRLKIIYNESYKLEKKVEGDIFHAYLKINLLEHKTKMLTAGR